jgi:hypothetical protein
VYNLPSLIQTDLVQVPLVGAEQVAEKRVLSLRGLVICITILALTVSLATRTVHGSIYTSPTVHSASDKAKVQHRDKDASEWVTPVLTFAPISVTEPSVVQTSTEGVFFDLHYDSLYNRPPPIT